jgi:hypothetical protein
MNSFRSFMTLPRLEARKTSGRLRRKSTPPGGRRSFNRFEKRYRIGISTFGRARFVPREDPSRSKYMGLRLFSDLAPIDVAGNPDFNRGTTHTEANELVLSYRSARKARIGYNDFQPGDMVEFILPTPEAVRTAVESARRMRGNCAGVVFFRWPASNENLIMQPDETLMAAGLAPREQKVVGVEEVDGHCAAVSCEDLYLANATALSSRAFRYRIRSSTELEYFLPQERVPVRMADPSDIELALPAYAGMSRMLLGARFPRLTTRFGNTWTLVSGCHFPSRRGTSRRRMSGEFPRPLWG